MKRIVSLSLMACCTVCSKHVALSTEVKQKIKANLSRLILPSDVN